MMGLRITEENYLHRYERMTCERDLLAFHIPIFICFVQNSAWQPSYLWELIMDSIAVQLFLNIVRILLMIKYFVCDKKISSGTLYIYHYIL